LGVIAACGSDERVGEVSSEATTLVDSSVAEAVPDGPEVVADGLPDGPEVRCGEIGFDVEVPASCLVRCARSCARTGGPRATSLSSPRRRASSASRPGISDVPAREVDVLAVHGRRDAVVAFSQHAAQRDAALAYWPFGAPAVFREDATHKATRWTTPSGTVLESWEHDYEAQSVLLRGHCFPGSSHAGSLIELGFGRRDPGTFVFGEIALAFFQAHPR